MCQNEQRGSRDGWQGEGTIVTEQGRMLQCPGVTILGPILVNA